jgi:Flp pilus assembly protein TadG
MLLKLRRRWKGAGRQERGVVTVEFALCIIPLLLIVGGIIDYGESWYMQSMLAAASRAGARYATRYQPDAGGQRIPLNNLNPSVQDYVLNTAEQNGGSGGYGLRALLPNNAEATVTLGGPGYPAGTVGASVSVTVSGEKYWLLLNHLIPGLTNPQLLASTTVMACE